MGDSIPIVIIVIGVILVVIALLVWTKRKEVKLELERINDKKKKAFFAQWIIGIVIALLAAIFMFDGDILGENTAGISTIMGICGICLIATSSIHLLPLQRK
jgi:LPXTG-motif cell wall-anchored protein